MIVLADVDHCISDARWRDHLIPDWPRYHKDQIQDAPVSPVIRMLNSMSLCGCTVYHITARRECYRANTLSWMLQHGVFTSGLLMRPDNDYRTSPDLKEALAEELLGKDLDGLGLVIDDRDDVLERFRARGITTIQVGLGGAWHDPNVMRRLDEAGEVKR